MAIIERCRKQKQYWNYLVEKSEKMSRLKDCVKNGEVKESVICFIDAYEDMFDCCVTNICVCAIGDDGNRLEVNLKREV